MSPGARRLLAGMTNDELQTELGRVLRGPHNPEGSTREPRRHLLGLDPDTDAGTVAQPAAAVPATTAAADHWYCIGACIVTEGACPALTPRRHRPPLTRLLDLIGRPA